FSTSLAGSSAPSNSTTPNAAMTASSFRVICDLLKYCGLSTNIASRQQPATNDRAAAPQRRLAERRTAAGEADRTAQGGHGEANRSDRIPYCRSESTC